MSSLFISSLPFGADDKFVRELFSDYGQVVSVELHADWVNPTYEPFAYVELEVPDVASVVDALDGKKFGQNHLRVHQRVILPSRSKSEDCHGA